MYSTNESLDLFPPTLFFDEGTHILGVVMTHAQITALNRVYQPGDVSIPATWQRKTSEQLAGVRRLHIRQYGKCELRCYPRLYDGALV